jgi:alpha-1,2-mannosyltransferase
LKEVCLLALSAILGVWNIMLVLVMTKLAMNDFGKFYHSARFFLQGTDMYQPSPATSFAPLPSTTLLNMNPPHVHLPILPLAYLTPTAALLVWLAMNAVCLVTVLWLIRGTLAIRLGSPLARLGALCAFLGFAATGAVLVTGQLSFLITLPMTLAWLAARQGRWRAAGAYLGILMSIKPLLLVFVPYFLIRGKRDAVLGSIATFVACFALGVVVFGLVPYQDWIRTLGSVDWEWLPMNGSLAGLLHRTLSSSPVFAPIAVVPTIRIVLWGVGITFIAAVTFFVSWRDTSSRAVDRAFAILILAALLISPLGWVYYLWLALGPMAVIVGLDRSGKRAIAHVPSWLLRSAGVLLFVPVTATALFQPSVVATATLASVYSWALLLLWLALILDWWTSSLQRGLPEPGPSRGRD